MMMMWTLIPMIVAKDNVTETLDTNTFTHFIYLTTPYFLNLWDILFHAFRFSAILLSSSIDLCLGAPIITKSESENEFLTDLSLNEQILKLKQKRSQILNENLWSIVKVLWVAERVGRPLGREVGSATAASSTRVGDSCRRFEVHIVSIDSLLILS